MYVNPCAVKLRSIWSLWKRAAVTAHDKFADVHTRIMKRNYEAVPQWWFISILVIFFGLSIWTCEGFGGQLQLPYWGVILACALAFVFTLPIGVISATTNQVSHLPKINSSVTILRSNSYLFCSSWMEQQPGLNIITELVIGYLYPGRPLANVAFKTYGYISMSQALFLVQDFKLGHYMKIPPKSMFLVQVTNYSTLSC